MEGTTSWRKRKEIEEEGWELRERGKEKKKEGGKGKRPGLQ